MENKITKLTVVVAIIVNPEGKFLLQKRIDLEFSEAHGKWEFPGGSVDIGESKEEALQRECKEEIGCPVVVGQRLSGIQKRTWTSIKGYLTEVEVYGYLCRVAERGEPSAFGGEVEQIGWFNRDEAKNLDTIPGVVDFLEQVQTNGTNRNKSLL